MKSKKFFAMMMSAVLCTALSPLPQAMTGFAEDDHVHMAECSNPTVCAECGATIPYDADTLLHNMYYVVVDGGHQHICACGAMNEEPEEHYVSCANPGICTFCEAKTDMEPDHEEVLVSSDKEYDYFACACGEVEEKTPHEDECDNPGTCIYCGQTDKDGIVISVHSHAYDDENCIVYKDEDTHTIHCVCGEEAIDYPHICSCTGEEHICAECGGYAPNAGIAHNETIGGDADSCYIYCKDCGIEIARFNHHTSCLNPDAEVCADCGFKLSEAKSYEKGMHESAFDQVYEEKGVTYHECICQDCGETVLAKHEVIEVAEDNGDSECHNIVCKNDGYVLRSEEHTWVMDEEKGAYVCSVCGAVGQSKSETTTTATTTGTTVTTTTAATAVTTTTDSAKRFASDDELCTMAIEDYRQKTGVTPAKAECTAGENGMLSVVLTDEAGKVLDTYTIDPATGIGQSSSGSEVNLPQTGNNSMTNWLIVCVAFIMIGCGLFTVMESGIVRRKED